MATGTVSLRELVNPTPKQDEFLRATRRHLFTLYGGAGGGGKSYILRWNLVALLLEWAAQGHIGVMVGLFCEDYPSLKDRHLKKAKREFPPWLGRYKEQDHEYHLNPQFGGGIIAFRNLDDPSKYASVEFAAIAVDELTKNERQTFDDLRWRRRWPGIARCPFMGATNPGSVGHAWVKKLWLDHDFSGEPKALEPDEFAYIPAKATDNPHLEPTYIKELESLPEVMRRAVLDGDWDIFQGQVFSEWRREKHVISVDELPDGWRSYRKFVSVDWGRNKPGCALWWAIAPDGRLYVYREFYFNGEYTADMDAYDAAQAILKCEGDGEGVAYRSGDPSMWSKTGTKNQHGESMADDFAAAGCHLQRADNDRIQGVNRVHRWLKDAPDGRPWVQVVDTCKHLIRTLPALPRDPKKVEDVDTDAEDHAYDAFRYGVMSRPIPGDSTGFLPGGDRGQPRRKPSIDEWGSDDDDDGPKGPTFYGQ